MRKYLKLEESGESLNKNFYALGYHSVFFVINIGTLLFVGVYLLLVLFFIAATKNIKNVYVVKLRVKAKESVMWSSVLSYINEGYIVFVLACSMQYKNLSFKPHAHAFSSVLALISGVILIASPLTNLVLMLKCRDRLEEPHIKSKIGTLYEKLRTGAKDNFTILLEPFASQMRILYMSLALIYLEDFPVFQLMQSTLFATFAVIYINTFRVYKEPEYQFF